MPRDLKNNYKRLRDAGFSADDARSMRGLSAESLAKVIATGVRPPKSKRHVKAGKAKKHLRLARKTEKKYLSAYTFIIEYRNKSADILQHITLTYTKNEAVDLLLRRGKKWSGNHPIHWGRKMILAEARDLFADIVDKEREKYESPPIISSLRIISAIYLKHGV